MLHLDQLHRNIHFEGTPKRIISLVPSQTELLVDLGLEACIVGVTKFCIHPKQLRKEKTIVGGTKQVDFQKIKNLQPDIILCNKEENTKAMIEELERIAPVHISDVNTIEDCFKLIEMYGTLFQISSKASAIIDGIKHARLQFQNKNKHKKRLKVAYFIWKQPWMVAASRTFINQMLNEAGYRNAFENQDRYPEITLEHPSLIAADVLFLSSEPYPFKEAHVNELKSRFASKQILVVDGEMFSWHGSRLQKAYTYFEDLNL